MCLERLRTLARESLEDSCMHTHYGRVGAILGIRLGQVPEAHAWTARGLTLRQPSSVLQPEPNYPRYTIGFPVSLVPLYDWVS